MDEAGSSRILVVDDDAFLRQLVTALLRRDGHQVTQAASAEEARMSLTAEPGPDLLILDVELPDQSGLDLLAEVRTSLTCPVILMSGNDTEPNRAAATALGAIDYVVKPFTPKTFIGLVGKALAGGKP